MVITVSDFERKTILKGLKIPEEKLEVVYNGVGKHFNNKYSKEQLAEVKQRYSLPEGFVLFLGNTAPKKNLDNVVKAFAAYVEKFSSDYKLVIVDFSEENLVKVLRENNLPESLKEKISLPGYVKNVDLPAFYGLAKLFLYPSLRESFGIPILESMACATPVISSTTSSMPEVAGDAALLIDPYNYMALSDAMAQILHNDILYNELQSKGLQRAQEFTWEKTAINVLKVYKSIK